MAPQLALLLHSCFDLQTRNRFEGTRSEVESLMKKMKENPHEHKNLSPNTMEGYLYVQEKRRRPGRYGEGVWGAVVCWSGGHGSQLSRPQNLGGGDWPSGWGIVV